MKEERRFFWSEQEEAETMWCTLNGTHDIVFIPPVTMFACLSVQRTDCHFKRERKKNQTHDVVLDCHSVNCPSTIMVDSHWEWSVSKSNLWMVHLIYFWPCAGLVRRRSSHGMVIVIRYWTSHRFEYFMPPVNSCFSLERQWAFHRRVTWMNNIRNCSSKLSWYKIYSGSSLSMYMGTMILMYDFVIALGFDEWFEGILIEAEGSRWIWVRYYKIDISHWWTRFPVDSADNQRQMIHWWCGAVATQKDLIREAYLVSLNALMRHDGPSFLSRCWKRCTWWFDAEHADIFQNDDAIEIKSFKFFSSREHNFIHDQGSRFSYENRFIFKHNILLPFQFCLFCGGV